MKEFIKKLFSDSPEVSSKRFIAIAGLFLLLLAELAIFIKIAVPMALIYSLVGLISAAAGLTTIEKNNQTNSENQ
jgi:hypothetical protein